MNKKLKIGLIREGKTPADSRVLLNPTQCAELIQNHPIEIVVQPSNHRCYTNEEYQSKNIPLAEDLTDCDYLMGIKEVPINQLVNNKAYFFFSHTIKEQAYNRSLLQSILAKNIQLIDYEVLKNEKSQRLIAFGKFAGMVGAHNALLTYGARTGSFKMKRMKDCFDYNEAKEGYQNLNFPPIRIVLTGNGRVANGAALVLKDMGIRQVTPIDYLYNKFDEIVFTQLACKDYVARKDGKAFELNNFFQNPKDYKSIFLPYAKSSDIMINGIYWDNNAPQFFSKEEMKKPYFKIEVIADVTCDIAPASSIPSTLRPATIAEPFFGYNPITEKEVAPFQENSIDMMTIDTLPNEMPRDASEAFGNQFITYILPELFKEESNIIAAATIAKNGQLGKHFEYLQNYVNGDLA